MRVLVLGAGVIGTTAAWYLAARGHEVTVVDRRPAPGMETSFANGGQVSVSHPEPWANPEAPARILRWMTQSDSPLYFRLRMDPAQWLWGFNFLLECRAHRVRENVARISTLARYSLEKLKALRESTGIEYDQLQRGIVHFYTDEAAFEAARAVVPLLKEHGVERQVKSREELLAIEPTLANAGVPIVGGTFAPGDESGDAHRFTTELARMAALRGVRFLYGREILAIGEKGDEIAGVVIEHEGKEHVLTAHAYVVALGSYSPHLTGPVGVYIPVYPAKGYSITADVTDASRAPTVSLTDEAAKLVISRLGNRLRIAGTAELSGYSTDLNPARLGAIVKRAKVMFPGAGDFDAATPWTGLRPATPSNVPLVGRTRFPNLFLDTGHGTLGWTLACGSGALLADIISGRKPEIEFPPP